MADESTAKRARALQKINVSAWLEENKDAFLPPVCNKLMFGGQMKIMFIGGPNQRRDFHIEEGEELFYQIKGDMILRVMEKGEQRDVPIREGEMFILPGRIPHSPQRFENTMGLVIERERLADETDGLRYYVKGDEKTPLWEEWFHCHDLGTQLGPVIKSYFASEQHKTNTPIPGDHLVEKTPISIDVETKLADAVPVGEWLDKHKEQLAKGPVDLFDAAECKVTVLAGDAAQPEASFAHGEVWFWQHAGEGSLQVGGETAQMATQDCVVVNPGERFAYQGTSPASVAFQIVMYKKQ